MPPRNLTLERAQLDGALDMLAALHDDLVLRRDEGRDESAREAYDEMLTVLAALETEHRRRRAALPPVSTAYATYVVLLDEHGAVHPLPHRLYVALVRGEAAAPQFAGRTLRLAEWYARLKNNEPETVVNENYGFITFDAEGRVDWPATPAFHPHRPHTPAVSETAALPTRVERHRIETLLFGNELNAFIMNEETPP